MPIPSGAKIWKSKIVAVDPHTSPVPTDPMPRVTSSYEEFLTNLRRTGVEQNVEVHCAFSRDLAADWDRPIRLLWIHGDHTYAYPHRISLFTGRIWYQGLSLRCTM